MLGKFLISLCLFIQIGSISVSAVAFKLENVHVPKYGLAGEETDLYCYFTLGDETLNNVKWYKDGLNFYTYIPTETLPRLHLASGVNVDVSKSNVNRVHLKNLTQASAGNYMCEVSTSSHPIATKGSEMNILVGPSSDPYIRGFPATATVGETLTGNCTSYSSKPAAKIAFFINDEPVENSSLIQLPTKTGVRGTETSSLGLTFTVESKHMTSSSGRLEIKCVATLDEDFEGMWVKVKVVYESQPSRRRSSSFRGRQSTTSAPQLQVQSSNLVQHNWSNNNTTASPQLQVLEPLTLAQTQRQTQSRECTNNELILSQLVELIQNQNRELEKISGTQLEHLEIEKERLELRKQELEFLRGLKRSPIKSV